MYIPSKIRKLLGNETYEQDTIGMSDASVCIFKDKVLKIRTSSEESENEYCMMK